MPVQRKRPTLWILLGGAVATIWALPMLRAALTPIADRMPFEAGFIQSLTSLDRSLAMAALGLAVGAMSRTKLVVFIVLLAAMQLSFWSTPRFLVVFQAWQGMWRLIGLVGPAGLVVAGLALFLPQRAKTGLLPLLAALVGFGLGISIEVNRPAADPILGFAFGSMYSSLGIGLVAAYAMDVLSRNRTLGKTWVTVAMRISGSWLIAIGLLLGGLGLLPPKMSGEPIVPISPPLQLNQSAQP